ncbi:MAG: type II secretion system major pseudopilin GspG [Sedimentisphaerales bacterium]|nr:type II secretion system major pseudopilin GspG [Sedimentisphaerales bacterium]
MRRRRLQKRAFTLVEVMAVLLIVGLLAGLAIQSFMGSTDKAKQKATQAKLKILHQAVNLFKLDTGRYPTEEEGLLALIEQPTDVENWQPGGYLEETQVPLDAWNHDFIFMRDPESGKPFVLISFGADGEEGGEGFDADLYSTDPM